MNNLGSLVRNLVDGFESSFGARNLQGVLLVGSTNVSPVSKAFKDLGVKFVRRKSKRYHYKRRYYEVDLDDFFRIYPVENIGLRIQKKSEKRPYVSFASLSETQKRVLLNEGVLNYVNSKGFCRIQLVGSNENTSPVQEFLSRELDKSRDNGLPKKPENPNNYKKGRTWQLDVDNLVSLYAI